MVAIINQSKQIAASHTFPSTVKQVVVVVVVLQLKQQ